MSDNEIWVIVKQERASHQPVPEGQDRSATLICNAVITSARNRTGFAGGCPIAKNC